MSQYAFRTRALGAVLCLLLTLALAGTVVAPPAHAGATVTLTGTYQLVATDLKENYGHAHRYRHVLVVGDQMYDLKLQGKPPVGNTKVTVRGTKSGRTVTVARLDEAGGSTPSEPTVSAQTASGTTRVLAILAHWTQPDAVTRTSMATELFGTSNEWFREVSYGALGQSGDVAGWYSIPGPTNGLCYTNMHEIYNQATSAARLAGYDSATYDRTIIYFPYTNNPDCASYAGWAFQPGNVVWLNGASTTRTITHEQGHNHGLTHAQSYSCGGLVLGSTCSTNEYGDPFDAMGASGYVAHFSGPQKDRMGWLTGRKTTLSGNSTATLAPYELSAVAPQVAAIPVSTSRTYWLEYRQPIGKDARLPAGATNGVLVHLTDSTLGGVKLLDGSPDGSFYSAVVPPGSTWTTPEGIKISVGTPTSAGIPVSTGTGSTSVEPPSSTPPSAPTTVTATAGDASASVSWQAPTSTGTAPIDSYTVVASPGGKTATVSASTRSVNMTGLTNGTSYTFTVKATSAAGSSPWSTPSNAVTPTAPATPPSAPGNVAATAGDASASVSWQAPTSTGTAPIDSYTVVASPSGKTATVSASTRSLNMTGLTNGTTYTFTVKATSAAGSSPWSSPSNAVTPTAPPSSGGSTPSDTSTTAAPTALNVSLSDSMTWAGNTVTVGGRLVRSDTGAPVVNETVLIQFSSKGNAWTTVTTTITSGTGTVSVPVVAATSGYFRLRFLGTSSYTGSTSNSVRLKTKGGR